jgi:hypothetical protein
MARVSKVISGGQTGVDRAALDAAMMLGIAIGGWCPRDRWAEDGAIPSKYPLEETKSHDRSERTARNVQASSATLILHDGANSPGTRFTEELARSGGKPCLVAMIHHPRIVESVRHWLDRLKPDVLNVAGPRESESPGVYEEALEKLVQILK